MCICRNVLPDFVTGSSKERQERVDALLDVVAEKKRVPIASLTTLAVRSWLVNRKTAAEYVDLLLQACWVELEGMDYLITPAGRKHLLAINDWPADEEKVLTRTERAKLAKRAELQGEPVEIVQVGARHKITPPAADTVPTPAPEAPPSPPSETKGAGEQENAGHPELRQASE